MSVKINIKSNAKKKEEKALLENFAIAYSERNSEDNTLDFKDGKVLYTVSGQDTKEFEFIDFNDTVEEELANKLSEYITKVNEVASASGHDASVFDMGLMDKLFRDGVKPDDAVVDLSVNAKKPKKGGLKGAKAKREAAKDAEEERARQEDEAKREALHKEIAGLSESLGSNLSTEIDSAEASYAARIEKGHIIYEIRERAERLSKLGDNSYKGQGLIDYLNKVSELAMKSRKVGADSANITKGEVSKVTSIWKNWYINAAPSGEFKADGMLDASGKKVNGTFKIAQIDPEKLYMTANYVTGSNLNKLASFLATQPRSVISKAVSVFDTKLDNVAEIVSAFDKVIHDSVEEEVNNNLDKLVEAKLIELGKDKKDPKEPSKKTLKVEAIDYNNVVDLANKLTLRVPKDKKDQLFEDRKPIDYVQQAICSVPFADIVAFMVNQGHLSQEEAAMMLAEA